jgi:hypothetical protein
MQWIFFLLFAGVILVTYLAVRRQWTSPALVAAVSVIGSMITMTLFIVSDSGSLLRGIVIGPLVGIVFTGATLAIAWYFHSNELRAQGQQTGYAAPSAAEDYYD